jgi:short-subunit dehydrogenase
VEVRTACVDLTAPALEQQISALTGELEVGLLIYNAGAIHGAGLFLDEPLEKARTLVQLNCNGPVTLCHGQLFPRGRPGPGDQDPE